MDIAEIKKEREDLEKELADILRDFEVTSSTKVSGVYVHHADIRCYSEKDPKELISGVKIELSI